MTYEQMLRVADAMKQARVLALAGFGARMEKNVHSVIDRIALELVKLHSDEASSLQVIVWIEATGSPDGRAMANLARAKALKEIEKANTKAKE